MKDCGTATKDQHYYCLDSEGADDPSGFSGKGDSGGYVYQGKNMRVTYYQGHIYTVCGLLTKYLYSAKILHTTH